MAHSMDHQEYRQRQVLVYGLLVLGIIARLAPHPWNATPLMAIALFGGTHLSKRWAILLPLAIVAISDWLIGWHATIPFTWGACIFTGLIAWWLRPRPSAPRILAGALAGSVTFYLITNFGVWFTQELYPRTAAGLWQCYVAAIPFFRGTLAGDLLYTTILFGGHSLLTSPRALRQNVVGSGK